MRAFGGQYEYSSSAEYQIGRPRSLCAAGGADAVGAGQSSFALADALALTGRASDAVRTITSAITASRSTGSTLWMPFSLSYLVIAYAELHQFDDAWRCIAEAMSAVESTKERWCDAEINRMAGEIALMSPSPDAAKPETYFERALAVARAQQAKSCAGRGRSSPRRMPRDQITRRMAPSFLTEIAADQGCAQLR